MIKVIKIITLIVKILQIKAFKYKIKIIIYSIAMNSNISNSENNIKKIKTNVSSTNPTPEKVADKEDSLSIIKSLSVDGVLVNLKIFSKIRKYDKLCFSGDALEIDNRYAAFVRRWLSSDDRAKSIEYINAVINRAFVIVDKTYDSERNTSNSTIDKSPFKEENSNLLQRFSIELGNTVVGLGNLKSTYKEDSLTKSKIDLVIDKIKIRIEKINKLLKIHV